MQLKTLLILGDSTSMSIGIEHKMYPFVLAAERRWPAGMKIVNCSLPGNTAADACSFFFKHRKNIKDLSAVIIYLGNCDTMKSEIKRGKYTPLRQFMDAFNGFFGGKKEKTRLQNRLLHYEWNDIFNPSFESPESPSDYEYNLARVIHTCCRDSIPVIVVRPLANRLFPAGLGKGNFLFYRYLGLRDQSADQLNIADERFKAALKQQERGQFKEACTAYKEILTRNGPNSGNPEFLNIIVNNYAVSAAEDGNTIEAEYLLNLLLKERGVRKEIIYYNLARLKKSEEYRTLSCEADDSMFRVRMPYIEAVDRLAKRFTTAIQIIDMHAFVNEDAYVDHCHPLPETQIELAKRISEVLNFNGDQAATIENLLYSPELSIGNTTEFYDYFRAYAPYRTEEIARFVEDLKVSTSAHVPEEMKTAADYYLRHPAFPSMTDILHHPPCYPSDIGRFPEFFLVRSMLPYLAFTESEPKLQNRFTHSAGKSILPRSKDLVRALPPRTLEFIHENSDINFDATIEAARLPKILSKIRFDLAGHLNKGNQIQERLKSTIFWYFRETLRFGSHSRISMRYDRIFLEFTAEALAVAGVLDLKLGLEHEKEILRLIQFLEEAVRTHEHFCSYFSAHTDSKSLLAKYDQSLARIAKELSRETDIDPESEKCIS